jgi:hypothetical protein
MSELGSLFLVVLLLYLLQCVHWVSPDSAVFSLNCRGRGKQKRHGFVWSAWDTAGFLAGPWPPLAPIVVTNWPAFQPDAATLGVPQANGEHTFRPWSELVFTHSDNKLLCNGKPVFKGSEAQVARCAALLEQLQRAGKPERQGVVLRWLHEAMNTRTPARRLAVFTGRSRLLRVLANVQLVMLFLALPMAFIRFGPGVLWRVAVVIVAISAAITLEFWTLHRRLFSDASSARFKSALTIMLSPVAAIRACDMVARDLLSEFHPLAVAAVILPTDEFRYFAGEHLRLNRFGAPTSQWYRENLGKLMERLILQRKIAPEELLRPAEPDSGAIAYCPRCLAQYVKIPGACTDCGFGQVVRFERASQTMRTRS